MIVAIVQRKQHKTCLPVSVFIAKHRFRLFSLKLKKIMAEPKSSACQLWKKKSSFLLAAIMDFACPAAWIAGENREIILL